MAYASVWRDWPQNLREFALRRLGMTYLRENVLPRLAHRAREEFILDTTHGEYFQAVRFSNGNLEFSDYPEEVVDRAVRNDLCFALKQRRFVGGTRVPLRDFPAELLSNFWTEDEIERNILDMEREGLVEVQLLPGRVEHGVSRRSIEALGLTRDGERLAMQLLPDRRALFDSSAKTQAATGEPAGKATEAGAAPSDSPAESVSQRTTKAPAVFISYSHDSRDHKRWVAQLATQLRRKGVDVILDQWDLHLGEDLPKFMETGIGRADRVLVICTPDYVSKVDSGQGGAGYEGMIITGELVRDLGSRKFIPVIRRADAEKKTPTCLATRLHIDCQDDSKFDDNLVELLRQLYGLPPGEKPPLGESPFDRRAAEDDSASSRSRGDEPGEQTDPQDHRRALTSDQVKLLSWMKEHGGVVAVSRTLSGVSLCFLGGEESPRLTHGTFGAMGGIKGQDFSGVKWDVVLRELEELGEVRQYGEDVYVLRSASIDPSV